MFIKAENGVEEGTEEEEIEGQGVTGTAGVERGLEGRTPENIRGTKEEVTAKETERPEIPGSPEET